MVNEKYTTEQMIEALKAVNGMVYLAARKLGCEPKTIYNRAKKVAIVQQAIEDSRGELVDIAEQKLRGAVLDREPWAVALVLKTLGKNRGYVERTEQAQVGSIKVEHNGKVNLSLLTTEELEAYGRIAAKLGGVEPATE